MRELWRHWCYVFTVMRPKRTLKLVFAMLLIAMLPLRGFTAAAHCESEGSALHAPHATHCHDTARLHACGDCCGIAAIALAAPLAISRPPVEDISSRPSAHPPTLDLDRLDRPPRPAA